MGQIEHTHEFGVGLIGQARPKLAVAVYDFAVDGGAVESKNLRGDKLPSGAIILDSLLGIETALAAGAEATGLLTAESSADLQASKKITEAPWKDAKPVRGAVTATGAPVVTTAERSVVFTIGTAAVTAGKFTVVVTYLDPA